MRLFGFDVKGVVFDCDGVLVDSEPFSVRAWSNALHGLGMAVPESAIAAFVGTTERTLAEHYAPPVGRSVEEVEQVARAELLRILTADAVPRFDDADRLRASLTVPFAVASNSFRWRLDAILGSAGIGVEHSFAGDEVKAPKPAPDIYLAAAERLGVDPPQVMVIEDTVTGMTAAKSAGCLVVGVERHPLGPNPADLVVPDLETW